MEQNKKRRLAHSPKTYSKYYNYPTTAQETRLSVYVADLHGAQPITLRTAVYEARTYGGVRGALRQFLAELSTLLVVRPSFYFVFTRVSELNSAVIFVFGFEVIMEILNSPAGSIISPILNLHHSLSYTSFLGSLSALWI
jgi:hypothetical protein